MKTFFSQTEVLHWSKKQNSVNILLVGLYVLLSADVKACCFMFSHLLVHECKTAAKHSLSRHRRENASLQEWCTVHYIAQYTCVAYGYCPRQGNLHSS